MARDLTLDCTLVDDAAPVRKRLLRRIYDRMIAGQQARADRVIEQYIATRGGVLTDDIEREISRKYGGIVGG